MENQDPNWNPQRAAECDALLATLITSDDPKTRLAAGRKLGIVSPEGVEPVQSTVITRAIRLNGEHGDQLWSRIEGAQGPIAEYLFGVDDGKMHQILACVGAIVTYPLLDTRPIDPGPQGGAK